MIQMGTHSAFLRVCDSCAIILTAPGRVWALPSAQIHSMGKNMNKQGHWCYIQIWMCPLSPIKSLQKQQFSTSPPWTSIRISSWKPLNTANLSTQGPAICTAACILY